MKYAKKIEILTSGLRAKKSESVLRSEYPEDPKE